MLNFFLRPRSGWEGLRRNFVLKAYDGKSKNRNEHIN